MTDELERKRKQHELENVLNNPKTRMTAMESDLFMFDPADDTLRYEGEPSRDLVDVPLDGNVVITHVEDYERKPPEHHAHPGFDSMFRLTVTATRNAYRRYRRANPK